MESTHVKGGLTLKVSDAHDWGALVSAGEVVKPNGSVIVMFARPLGIAEEGARIKLLVGEDTCDLGLAVAYMAHGVLYQPLYVEEGQALTLLEGPRLVLRGVAMPPTPPLPPSSANPEWMNP